MLAIDLLGRAKDGEGVKSGPIGLAVILVLCVAAYFLFKSMSKHLKRVRDEFPTEETAAAPKSSPKNSTETPAESGDPAQPAGASPTVDTPSPPRADSP